MVFSQVFQMDIESSKSLSQAVRFVLVSVAVCVLSSLFFFAFGYLCHRHCQRQKYRRDQLQSRQSEGILHKHPEQIELKENEAYGPLTL